MRNSKTATILPFEGKPWFSIKNKTEESADLYLYDEIGFWGDDGNTVIQQIKDLKVATLNVFINSPGGSVFDGTTIYNVLVRHPAKVDVTIDGIAASIASVIAMAGDTIRMGENAMMMIHDPMVMTWGRAEDLRKEADVLDQLKETIITTYAARTSQERSDLAKWMEEETWFDARRAEELKFVDEVIAAKKAAASLNFDLSNYKNTPERLSRKAVKQTPLSLLLRRQALIEHNINH